MKRSFLINSKQLQIIVESLDDSIDTSVDTGQSQVTNTFEVRAINSSDDQGYKQYFFNNPKEIEIQSPKPDKYIFKIPKGKNYLVYEFPKDYVKKSSNGNFYVHIAHFSKVTPYIEENPNKNEEIKYEKPSYEEMKELILRVLPISFDKFWKNDDGYFSSGVRDVYTIGEKTKQKTENDESWSIVNYFDTKKEIHELIWENYINDKNKGDKSLETWLTEKFNINDKTTFDEIFLKKLVDRQWLSIENGIDTENNFIKLIKDKFNIKPETYPPGSIMDRYEGVDITINGINFQVKPLKSWKKEKYFSQKKSEEVTVYIINTYGMKNWYKGKKLLNYILYINENDTLVFPNYNYFVDKNDKNGKVAKHYVSPLNLENILNNLNITPKN